MAIRIEKAFTIDVAPERVWGFLTDPHQVARCLPGASITEQLDERSYGGRMTIKVGPVSTAYKGKIVFERLDADTRTAELRATGQDVQGRGGADMRMTSRLTPGEGGQTSVSVVSEVNVTGILAQFGRGMIQDVSDQMFETFTANMRRALGGDGESTAQPPEAEAALDAAALDAVALGASVGGRAIGRLVRAPAFWVTLAIVAILAYLIFGR